MNEEVTGFIDNAPDGQREILEKLRAMIHALVPEVKEEFKWSRPVFRSSHDFAYFKTSKAYVTLGFFKAGKLDDPGGLLEGTGKDMRHIKIKKVEDINEPLLKNWLKAAAK